ncbi:unnamed protein product [Closterium sp. NIES-54]
MSEDKLSARAIPCIFLGFDLDAPGWKFYHPTSRRVLPSQDVTFYESVPFYRLFPYCSAPPPPPPFFLAPCPPPVAVGSGATPDAASRGTMSGGAEPGGAGSEGAGSGGAEPGGADREGVASGGAELEGAESGGAAPQGATSSGGPPSASPRLSSQQLREWLFRRAHHQSGALGAGGAGDTGAGVAAVTAGAGGTGGASTSGAGAAGTEALAQEALELPKLDLEALEPEALELLTLALEVLKALCSRDRTSFPCLSWFLVSRRLPPASPLPAPSPYTEQSGGLTERHEPPSHPVSPVRTACRVPRSSPPPAPNPESDRARATSPTISHLLATAVTDPSFESAAASALVAELLDFAAACRLDYATVLVAESVSASHPSVEGEYALGTNVLEDRQEDFECLAAAVPCFASMLLAPEGDPDAPDIPTPHSYAEPITGPYSSQWQAAMDAEKTSWKSTGTYVDEVFPSWANIVDGMWIFRVKRPPSSPPAFKARYVARGFSQRQGVDYFHTFSPTLKMTTLWAPREWHDTLRTTLAALGFAPATADPSLFLRTDTSLPPFCVILYIDDQVFATADFEALAHVKSEQQKRHTCTDLKELCSYLGLQITLDTARRTITLTQSHMVHQVRQRFGFQFSLPQPTPLSTSHSLLAPPSDESIEPSGLYPELVGCLMYLMMCTRPNLAYPLSLLARYVAPGRHRKVHWDAAKRVLRYLCSTSGMGRVLGGRGPVILTGHAYASWVDDLATQRSSQGYTFSLGATLAHLPADRLGRAASFASSSQRGQLRLAYVAARANTADVFTKALPPGDHQRFATVLGLVPTLPHLLTA